MKKKIAAALALGVACVLAVAATRPDTFHVERSADVAAAPEALYALVADFRAWRQWSPYDQLDPAMERTYSGAAAGQGAVYTWSGNRKVGAGRMEIVAAAPPSRLTVALAFTAPMAAENTASFSFLPQGRMTRVTWAMDGAAPYLHRVVGLFVNLDEMVGRDFATGLAHLKALAEGGPSAQPVAAP